MLQMKKEQQLKDELKEVMTLKWGDWLNMKNDKEKSVSTYCY